MGKSKQQPERVAIRADGVRTGLSLLHKSIGKEPL
jgi:hypothetical protein